MNMLSRILRQAADGAGHKYLTFWCPGCNTTHQVGIGDGPGLRWGWNGDAERPTFTPSVLVRMGHYAYDEPRDTCWCTYNRDHPDAPAPFTCQVCHSFVVDGRIQFLGDCSHALAGQTIDLPDFDSARPS